MVVTAARLDLREIDAIRTAVRSGQLAKARRLTLSGNDAVACAALEAGARFFAGYPITPSTEILEYVARHIFAVGGTYLQMEDEIASIGAVIGASLGGVKSFTATSGPGFSLKQENLGFACFNEIPLVIVNVQRGGPSTGGPTDVAQADIQQSRWGTHGDHPIIVISPASVQECYEETVRAFNLSEKYRIPVIVLSDAKVGQMKEPVILPPKEFVPKINRAKPSGDPKDYEPFGLTPGGVPPLAPFGYGYRFHVTGLNHGRSGLPTKDPKIIDEQLRRIHAKLTTTEARRDILKTETFFTEDAEVVLVAFGITARAAKEAVIRARRQGVRIGLVRPITLFPSDEEIFFKVFAQARKIVVAELNLGQYILEIKRLAYDFSQRNQEIPPLVVGLDRVDTQLITPADLLREVTA
ncbi:MAG: 2-oxoacid:acceptor oxidoreductase subunit alpha [Acidobacteria bacterium]|nr:2-oxoacid:acceptor oxidoreductase subunit alpha [Acidobacteriota bacterium]MBI3656095.1 2-oxoacid:acceptor oxidoreductase subunit alpha [Acidobacteriota bacterium]